MEKKMKRVVVLAVTMMLLGSEAISVYAGTWDKVEKNGWKYKNDDGSYITSGWKWVDGMCYYFDNNGMLLQSGSTPDGYEVGTHGEWRSNGVTQVQLDQNHGIADNEIKAAFTRAKIAGAGSYQGRYISGGWRTEEWNGDVLEYLRASKDSNSMVVSPTGGIVMRTTDGGIRCGGSDKSIQLKTDPSNGALQPNWLYNPLGQKRNAPPVICMDKNVYSDVSPRITYTDADGNPVCYMNSVDTSGSWINTGESVGLSDSDSLEEQISGWMYRYADGTYAANGMVFIYDNIGWGAGGICRIYSHAYVFNEDGFLIMNSYFGPADINEYGQVCLGDGPFGESWDYIN